MGRKSKDKVPVTMAVRALRAAKVDFEPMFYTYEEHGGTEVSARELGVDEHAVVKTLIFEDDAGQALVILMHGDREVAPGRLARAIGARKTRPAGFDLAHKHTGYEFGGTSPFGTRKPMPIYAEATIRELDAFLINGGKRGFLVRITPEDLERALEVTWVEAAAPVG
jgi:Cys-tRNA(Pro) deacylase